jgi:hypothetical protein
LWTTQAAGLLTGGLGGASGCVEGRGGRGTEDGAQNWWMMSLVDQARSKSSKAAIVLQSSERTSKRVGPERCAGPSSPFWAWTLASGVPHNNPVSGTPKTEQRHPKENQRSLRSGFHLYIVLHPPRLSNIAHNPCCSRINEKETRVGDTAPARRSTAYVRHILRCSLPTSRLEPAYVVVNSSKNRPAGENAPDAVNYSPPRFRHGTS